MKVFLACPDGTVDTREMSVHIDQFTENEINKILRSFRLYYQCQNTPILAVGGTCAVYSRSFRDLEGITTKWNVVDAAGAEAAIKQPSCVENAYVDFVTLTEDMVDKRVCVRVSYQSKSRLFITPTTVQHELNVEREFEHEFMNPQQSLAVNCIQLNAYPRVRGNVQLQVSQKLLAQLGKVTSVRWYCTDQSLEEILEELNVSFIRY